MYVKCMYVKCMFVICICMYVYSNVCTYPFCDFVNLCEKEAHVVIKVVVFKLSFSNDLIRNFPPQVLHDL